MQGPPKAPGDICPPFATSFIAPVVCIVKRLQTSNKHLSKIKIGFHFRYNTNLEVKMEMDSPIVTVQEEAKFYQMSDLIADAGGYMGLLLGASVFTFFELFEAFAQKFSRKWERKK